jgi:hypothetical protein
VGRPIEKQGAEPLIAMGQILRVDLSKSFLHRKAAHIGVTSSAGTDIYQQEAPSAVLMRLTGFVNDVMANCAGQSVGAGCYAVDTTMRSAVRREVDRHGQRNTGDRQWYGEWKRNLLESGKGSLKDTHGLAAGGPAHGPAL